MPGKASRRDVHVKILGLALDGARTEKPYGALCLKLVATVWLVGLEQRVLFLTNNARLLLDLSI